MLVLILRIVFTVLLYLFLFSLVRAIRDDLRRAARLSEPGRGSVHAAPEGRLIVLDPGGTGLARGYSLPLATATVIGRAPDSHIRIDDAFVSHHHARLWRENGRWMLEDLRSTNGTLLNNEPIAGRTVIEYGDTIQVGSVRLKLAR